MKRVAVAILVLAAAALPARAADEAEFGSVVAKTVDGYVLPGYQRLSDATAGLTAAAEAFCASPDAGKRQALDETFRNLLIDWAGVDFLRFGPMAQEGRYERFAYWPDVHGTGARQLRRMLATDDPKLLQPGALAGQSAAVQGLPALESLLYSGSSALLSAEAPDSYKCSLAVAISENMHEIAEQAVSGWAASGEWSRLLREPGESNPVYRTHKEATTEVLKAVLTGLEQMREHRMMPALGATPEEAKVSQAPYYASGATLHYLSASAEALSAFVETSGILDLVPDEQDWIRRSIRFEFANLKGALAGAGPDFEAALTDPEKRGKLTYASVVLASLRDLFQRQLSPAAGITAGFNSLDGD